MGIRIQEATERAADLLSSDERHSPREVSDLLSALVNLALTEGYMQATEELRAAMLAMVTIHNARIRGKP
jgi:MoxR-like ATPase